LSSVRVDSVEFCSVFFQNFCVPFENRVQNLLVMEMLQVVQAYKTVTIFACMLCSSSDGVSDSRTCFFVAFFFVDRLVRGLRFERKSGRVEREVKYLGNVFFSSSRFDSLLVAYSHMYKINLEIHIRCARRFSAAKLNFVGRLC